MATALWPSRQTQPRAPSPAPWRHRRLPPARALPSDPEEPEEPLLAPTFLEGRVEDAAHRRVAGARVELQGRQGEPVGVASGPDGSFRFEVPRDGAYFIAAEHERYSPGGWAGPIVVRGGAGPENLVVVVLGSAAALTVRVVDPGGAPLAGAHVDLDGAPAAGGLDTDARGEAEWSALPPETALTVRAQAAGYASGARPVRLQAGETTTLELQLVAGRDVAGRVLDPGRRRVAGAIVRVLEGPDGPDRSATTVTDEAGEFVLVDLPDEPVLLVAQHPDYAASAPLSVEPGTRDVDLVLRMPASIAGTVLGRDGSPAAGARLRLDGEGSSPAASADDEGVFSFTGLTPGEYDLMARQGSDAGRISVTLAPGQALDRLEVRLVGPFTATGTIVRRFTGEAVPGAQVRPRIYRGTGGEAPAGTTSDDRGRFVLPGLPLDIALLEVRAPGYRIERFPVSPTGTDLDLGEIGLEPRVFGGVGMTLAVRDGEVHILGLFDDAPGARAGLAQGDVILEIDGERVDGLELEDVVGRIRGTEGSDVRMLVRREGEAEPIQIDVTRATIDTDRYEREGH
jgi:carboxypeptidase family protein/PDZ domain-containing protein